MSIDVVLIGYLVIAVITAVFLAGVCIVSTRRVKFDDFITIITAAPFWPVVIFIVIMCLVDYYKNTRKEKKESRNGDCT
ncbi:hypothetical protein Pr121lw_32 [Escherichia phage vB_EcoM-Pr121LW]|uniref:Uncharacterized protein n=1 Tax=Escherichia phage vB_EcoM-Pr121LW TaxID=2306966 RepID=A0A385F1S8_9CAUD|nr:hypothetical protein Pr121lw_32 [Escherichia phage vB_EcoM-Pr121LW]